MRKHERLQWRRRFYWSIVLLLAYVLLFIIVFALLTSCSGRQTLELAVGQNLSASEYWTGGPNARATLRHDFSGRYFCDLTHVSHLLTGPPLNDNLETWYNEVACGMRFNLGGMK